ncbi:hypothetical protein [Streptomyces peucetius]
MTRSSGLRPRTDCDEHLLARLLALKSHQHMGCFPKLDEIPDTVVDFPRRAVDLPEGTTPRAANRSLGNAALPSPSLRIRGLLV